MVGQVKDRSCTSLPNCARDMNWPITAEPSNALARSRDAPWPSIAFERPARSSPNPSSLRIVPRRVRFRNGLAQAIDFDDQLHLVVHFLGPFRDVEWMLVAENRALGFEKNHGLRRHLVAEFTGVVGVVSAMQMIFMRSQMNQSFTKNATSTRLSKRHDLKRAPPQNSSAPHAWTARRFPTNAAARLVPASSTRPNWPRGRP